MTGSGAPRHRDKDSGWMNEQLRRAPSPDLLPRFAAIVGDRYAITDPAALEPYLHEGRGLFHGRTSMAQACLFAALAEFVTTYGEDAAAKFTDGLSKRIHNGEFSIEQRQ